MSDGLRRVCRVTMNVIENPEPEGLLVCRMRRGLPIPAFDSAMTRREEPSPANVTQIEAPKPNQEMVPTPGSREPIEVE